MNDHSHERVSPILVLVIIALSLVVGFYIGRRSSNPAPVVHKDYLTITPVQETN